jgi:hypothetical protein
MIRRPFCHGTFGSLEAQLIRWARCRAAGADQFVFRRDIIRVVGIYTSEVCSRGRNAR